MKKYFNRLLFGKKEKFLIRSLISIFCTAHYIGAWGGGEAGDWRGREREIERSVPSYEEVEPKVSRPGLPPLVSAIAQIASIG